MKENYQSAQSALRTLANPAKAQILLRFFKTGKGEYGEGDKFLGVMVPQIRKLVPRFQDLSAGELSRLLGSAYNEVRLFALLVMVRQYEKGDTAARERVYRLYLKNLKAVNNWNLVDASAPYIVGVHHQCPLPVIPAKAGIHLLAGGGGDGEVLYKLSKSKDMWARRVAIVSTLGLIRAGYYSDTLNISFILLKDKEDLIHKACGWMLREVGKRDVTVLENFLNEHAAAMPRTMLRYAIERFPEGKRRGYLRGESIPVVL
jgi:3-methyladenine DNA glycosylase AlkD